MCLIRSNLRVNYTSYEHEVYTIHPFERGTGREKGSKFNEYFKKLAGNTLCCIGLHKCEFFVNLLLFGITADSVTTLGMCKCILFIF